MSIHQSIPKLKSDDRSDHTLTSGHSLTHGRPLIMENAIIEYFVAIEVKSKKTYIRSTDASKLIFNYEMFYDYFQRLCALTVQIL